MIKCAGKIINLHLGGIKNAKNVKNWGKIFIYLDLLFACKVAFEKVVYNIRIDSNYKSRTKNT